MGWFSRKKKEDEKTESAFEFKKVLVDDFFIIDLPADWEPYESDRFRAMTPDGKTQISIKSYVGPDADITINDQYFKDLKLALYDRFVTEGEYEPYDNLFVNDACISKSFKVDDETQHYLTTARKIDGRLIVTDLIIRDIGGYDPKMQTILQHIMKSITPA